MAPNDFSRRLDELDAQLTDETSLLVTIGYWLLALSTWGIFIGFCFVLWELLK